MRMIISLRYNLLRLFKNLSNLLCIQLIQIIFFKFLKIKLDDLLLLSLVLLYLTINFVLQLSIIQDLTERKLIMKGLASKSLFQRFRDTLNHAGQINNA